MAQTTGSLNQITLNCSMGSMATRWGAYPSVLSADVAGSLMKFHNGLVKARLATNATAMPINARIIRERSSSRCSRNDMRSMPSSSLSPPPFEGGGGGGFLPPPPGRRETRATSVTWVCDAAWGAWERAGWLTEGSAGTTGSKPESPAFSESDGSPVDDAAWCVPATEDAPPPGGTPVPFCSSDGFMRYAFCSVVEADALCPFEAASFS